MCSVTNHVISACSLLLKGLSSHRHSEPEHAPSAPALCPPVGRHAEKALLGLLTLHQQKWGCETPDCTAYLLPLAVPLVSCYHTAVHSLSFPPLHLVAIIILTEGQRVHSCFTRSWDAGTKLLNRGWSCNWYPISEEFDPCLWSEAPGSNSDSPGVCTAHRSRLPKLRFETSFRWGIQRANSLHTGRALCKYNSGYFELFGGEFELQKGITE